MPAQLRYVTAAVVKRLKFFGNKLAALHKCVHPFVVGAFVVGAHACVRDYLW